MIWIVVLFAQEDELALRQAADERRSVDEASGRDIPDPAGERMVPPQGALPLFLWPAGARRSDQQDGGEEDDAPAMEIHKKTYHLPLVFASRRYRTPQIVKGTPHGGLGCTSLPGF